jgi:hypothetical protein
MKKKKLILKVLFDTNIIYTGSASDLLRQGISALIKSHGKHNDIEIKWYLPEIVLKERLFQMNKKGAELLIPIQKLEKLLGHNLNITKEIIGSRIDETIKRQLQDNEIEVVKIDTNKVDWENLINSAVSRIAPFEDNEKEKGFRDALILESLKQVLADSPTTKTICRIAFITNDGPLNAAATNLLSNHSNLYIYPDIDEFVSLINILDSEITEEIINKISLECDKLFFEKDSTEGLYYSANVSKQIKENFSLQLNSKPDNADTRENGTWWISKPGFEKKSKQTVTWKSIISIDFTTSKTTFSVTSTPIATLSSLSKGSSGLFGGIGSGLASSQGGGLLSSLSTLGNQNTPQVTTSKDKVSAGKTRFEIIWSVTLTTDNKLKNPKVDHINYLDTINN